MNNATYIHNTETLAKFNNKSPMYTIWGKTHDITPIADGIINVSTASHGGYIVSRERYDEMPLQYRVCSYTNDQNFEEDTSWCGVVLAWPEYFKADHIKAAQDTYDVCYGPNRRKYSWEQVTA